MVRAKARACPYCRGLLEYQREINKWVCLAFCLRHWSELELRQAEGEPMPRRAA